MSMATPWTDRGAVSRPRVAVLLLAIVGLLGPLTACGDEGDEPAAVEGGSASPSGVLEPVLAAQRSDTRGSGIAYADVAAARQQLGVSEQEATDYRSAGAESPAGRLALGLGRALPFVSPPRPSSTDRIIDLGKVDRAASTALTVGAPAVLAIASSQDDLEDRLEREGFERSEDLWVKPAARIGPDYYSVAAIAEEVAMFGFDRGVVRAALAGEGEGEGERSPFRELIEELPGVVRLATEIGGGCRARIAIGQEFEPPEGELVIVDRGGAEEARLEAQGRSSGFGGVDLAEPRVDGDVLRVTFTYRPPNSASTSLITEPPVYSC